MHKQVSPLIAAVASTGHGLASAQCHADTINGFHLAYHAFKQTFMHRKVHTQVIHIKNK